MSTFKQLSERLGRFVSIGNRKARALAVYDLAAKVRSFQGELAMGLADPNDPYGELASLSPKVKSTGKKMIAALDAFQKAVLGSEDSIDITPSVRGRLREQIECPLCGGKKIGGCRCASRVLPHTLEQIQAGHGNVCENGHRWSGSIVVDDKTGEVLQEGSQPKLNKYDPGSLLGWTVHLLKKEGLDDAADEVRAVSKTVSRAWQERER
jgi:hypothetical protein